MNIRKTFIYRLKNIANSVNCRIALMQRPVNVNYPFMIENLELTNKCPMKCIMCVRTYKMTRPQGFMKTEVFKKIIDEIVQINPPFIHNDGFWLHHFGESLLHPEFDKMISYCSERGIKVGLSLNPIMLTENIANRLIKAKPNLLLFAMDGHDDESFYKIRGIANSFNKSRENILRFLKLKGNDKSTVRVVISMIDFSENSQSIEEMRTFWKLQKGINDVFKKPFTDWNGDVGKITNLLEPRGLSVKNKTNLTNIKQPICRTPWIKMSITWDGDVVPCCFDYDKKYILGNVTNNTLSEIWNGQKIKDLRREFRGGVVENELCRNCRNLRG